MRAGAIDFVVKPVGAERLQVSIKNALQRRRARRRNAPHRRAAPPARLLVQGYRDRASPEMARVIRLGERAAKSTIPVLIEGESGVGKELMARAIQGASERRGKPFVAVNCGALPRKSRRVDPVRPREGRVHRRHREASGKFVEANGGTLFLDEVGELPLDTQVKLLRAIQEGEIDPVGAQAPGQGRCAASSRPPTRI